MPELDHTINALIRKRAEIAGPIDCHQHAPNQPFVDLDDVDHALRLLAPHIDLEEIEPRPVPPRTRAFKGEMKRLILDAMKRARGEAMSSNEIANPVMQRAASARAIFGCGRRCASAFKLRSRPCDGPGW